MTKRSAALLLVLVSLVFVTCTGCAGMVLKADGTMVAYAVGESKVQLSKTPASRICTGYAGDYTPAAGRTLVYSSRMAPGRKLLHVSGGLGEPESCMQTGAGLTVNVEGGNLGAGWFGAIVTFLTLYFAPVGAVL